MSSIESRPVAPRVFISYSHDSRLHQDRVRALADRLRQDGVDAVLDQYNTTPPNGWPMWMDREIQQADFVVLVCTDVYRARVEGQEEAPKGRGVLWEAKLIYNHLYQTDSAFQRFIPILMDGAGASSIPWPMRGFTHYEIDTKSGYEDLYRHLTGQSRYEKPALGVVKALPALAPQSYPASLDSNPRPTHPTSFDYRNRKQMLKRVRLDWVTGILDRPQYSLTRIELGLTMNSDAVAHPMNTVIRALHATPVAVPTGTTISQIFDDHAGSLLVLGDPGTGKTTLLLELASELLNRAEQDESHPIPVVFNLSSWAVRRQPLTKWLVAELNSISDVPIRVARRWVESDQIVPLLDGLDEVSENHRQACVDALNHFRRGHGLLPIVVCSRIADYEVLADKLRLQSAVVVEPLTTTQVDDYLQREGDSLQPLRTMLAEDPLLGELVRTPLMLWVAKVAYQHATLEGLHAGSVEERRRRLLASFVDAMFARQSEQFPCSRNQTVRWLSSMASTLTRKHETVFRLEHISPNWLPTRTQRWFARVGTIVVSGLFGGPGLGLVYGFLLWITALVLTPDFSLERLTRLLPVSLSAGLMWSLSWMGIAICFGLAGAFLDLKATETIRINLTEITSRLGLAIRRGALLGVAVWLGLLPMMLTLVGDTRGLVDNPEMKLWVAMGFPEVLLQTTVTRLIIVILSFGLLVGPPAGLLAGLVGLLCSETVEARTRLNVGTIRSVKAAVLSVLILALGGGAIGAFVSGPRFEPNHSIGGLILGGAYGTACGLVVGMVAGGLFALRHYAVRLVLWANRLAPLNYTRFLRHAEERLFLRRVGGGYIFTHRSIMEYFASL